jgi:hypothetical protein
LCVIVSFVLVSIVFNELIRIEEELGDRARMGELPWR